LSDPELGKIYEEKMRRMSQQASSVHPEIVKLTLSNFEGYMRNGTILLVDFWAVWCGPCRTMEPIVDKLAARYAGKIVVGKLNVDEESALATRFDVQSIPTFMLFKDGRPVDAAIGAVGEAALDRMIQRSAGSAR